MAQVTLKQGDTTPEFEAELDLERDLQGGEEIRFYMEHEETGDLIVNEPVTSVKESQNTVTYDFGSGETSRLGVHYGEVVVTYADGEIESAPANGYYEIDIQQPVNRSTPPADLDPGDATVTILTADEVALADTGLAPDAAGEIRHDGGDVKAHSGGAVRNLSDIGGEFDLNVRTVTGDTTAADNELVLVDTSNTAVTVTLNAPVAGMRVGVKVIDATNATTVATPGTETIDGRSELTITDQYVSRLITSDGSNYFIR